MPSGSATLAALGVPAAGTRNGLSRVMDCHKQAMTHGSDAKVDVFERVLLEGVRMSWGGEGQGKARDRGCKRAVDGIVDLTLV